MIDVVMMLERYTILLNLNLNFVFPDSSHELLPKDQEATSERSVNLAVKSLLWLNKQTDLERF